MAWGVRATREVHERPGWVRKERPGHQEVKDNKGASTSGQGQQR